MSWAYVAGAVIAAVGTYAQKEAEKKQLEYMEEEAKINAANQEVMAKDSAARGREAAQDHMRQVGQMKAQQAVTMAANGMDISQGTPASLLDDTDFMGGIDAARIARNSKREAWGFRAEGNNFMNTANMLGATASNINPAASGLLAGAGSVASNWGSISSGFKAKYGPSAGAAPAAGGGP